jgi:hypothetical protein
MLCTTIWAGATCVSARRPLVSITEIAPSASIVYSASGSPSFATRSLVPSALNLTALGREPTVTLLRKVGSGIGQVVKLKKPATVLILFEPQRQAVSRRWQHPAGSRGHPQDLQRRWTLGWMDQSDLIQRWHQSRHPLCRDNQCQRSKGRSQHSHQNFR